MPAKPNLLFDLDGTLTDSREGIEACLRHAFERVGRPLAAAVDLRWCIGPPLLESMERLLGPDHANLALLALRAYRERYSAVGLFENRVYVGIPAALDALSKVARLFVCTSKPQLFADRILGHFGLRRYFEGIYGSGLDAEPAGKAELIAGLLRDRGLDPGATGMVGDRAHDVLGAIASSVGAIGVLWGFGSREELEKAGARRLLAAPEELTALAKGPPWRSG